MEDINRGRATTGIDWKECKMNKDGETIPLKIWENLECVLEAHDIKVYQDVISHEIEFEGLNCDAESRGGKMDDIYSLQVKEFLNLSRDETCLGIRRIAEKNHRNPFVEMLEENENDDYSIIEDVFKCLIISEENERNLELYESLFTKWLMNVVKLAHNSLKKGYESQGILVLQGGQGTFKSTFCNHLMPKKEWFKGGNLLDPKRVDSVVQNTAYVLVELGELDGTLKAEQAILKAYISTSADEYRLPYGRSSEKIPRRTSYIATVNPKDFLKDPTGSRRFWTIPVEKCDIDTMKTIDMQKFWGAVYSLWKKGTQTDYLSKEDLANLNLANEDFNYVTDIKITLTEAIDMTLPEDEWVVYNTSQIAHLLKIKEKKLLSEHLKNMGFPYKSHRHGGAIKKGFKIPSLKMYEWE